MWLVAAGACGLTQWAVNQGLVLSAIRLEDPATRIKATSCSAGRNCTTTRPSCARPLLVALGMTSAT